MTANILRASVSSLLWAAVFHSLAMGADPQTFESVADGYAANQPLAWWRLREDADDKVAADVLNRNNGTYQIVHRAFDGEGSHVRLGTIDVDATMFSVLAFFQVNDFGQADARLISKATGTAVDDHYWMLSTVEVDGRMRLRFRLRTGSKSHELIAKSGDLKGGQWRSAAGTYDGRMIRLYLDGKEVASQAAQGRVATNSHCEAWIGDNPSGQGSRPFDGRIEDVALFDKALSSATLKAIADAGLRRATSTIPRRSAPFAPWQLTPRDAPDRRGVGSHPPRFANQRPPTRPGSVPENSRRPLGPFGPAWRDADRHRHGDRPFGPDSPLAPRHTPRTREMPPMPRHFDRGPSRTPSRRPQSQQRPRSFSQDPAPMTGNRRGPKRQEDAKQPAPRRKGRRPRPKYTQPEPQAEPPKRNPKASPKRNSRKNRKPTPKNSKAVEPETPPQAPAPPTIPMAQPKQVEPPRAPSAFDAKAPPKVAKSIPIPTPTPARQPPVELPSPPASPNEAAPPPAPTPSRFPSHPTPPSTRPAPRPAPIPAVPHRTTVAPYPVHYGSQPMVIPAQLSPAPAIYGRATRYCPTCPPSTHPLPRPSQSFYAPPPQRRGAIRSTGHSPLRRGVFPR